MAWLLLLLLRRVASLLQLWVGRRIGWWLRWVVFLLLEGSQENRRAAVLGSFAAAAVLGIPAAVFGIYAAAQGIQAAAAVKDNRRLAAAAEESLG